MRAVISRAKDFITSTDGPTATEYAIMLALIIIVAIVAISSLGTKASSVFSAVDGTLAVPGGS
jgi:pilus assembly protein Flp/PilA